MAVVFLPAGRVPKTAFCSVTKRRKSALHAFFLGRPVSAIPTFWLQPNRQINFQQEGVTFSLGKWWVTSWLSDGGRETKGLVRPELRSNGLLIYHSAPFWKTAKQWITSSSWPSSGVFIRCPDLVTSQPLSHPSGQHPPLSLCQHAGGGTRERMTRPLWSNFQIFLAFGLMCGGPMSPKLV